MKLSSIFSRTRGPLLERYNWFRYRVTLDRYVHVTRGTTFKDHAKAVFHKLRNIRRQSQAVCEEIGMSWASPATGVDGAVPRLHKADKLKLEGSQIRPPPIASLSGGEHPSSLRSPHLRRIPAKSPRNHGFYRARPRNRCLQQTLEGRHDPPC